MQKFCLHKLSTPFSQLSDLATILANVVLPIPLMPVKRYALADFLDLIEQNSSNNPPPLPNGQLPPGWSMEQWEWYGHEYINEQEAVQ